MQICNALFMYRTSAMGYTLLIQNAEINVSGQNYNVPTMYEFVQSYVWATYFHCFKGCVHNSHFDLNLMLGHKFLLMSDHFWINFILLWHVSKHF